MTVETATYVGELVTTNPPGTDQQSEGDDHLRLVKETIQNSLKQGTAGLTKELYAPTVSAKTSNYTVLATDESSAISVDATTGGVTVTLPLGSTLNIGFKIAVLKTDATGNGVTVVRSGTDTINGSISRSVSLQYQYEVYQLVASNLWAVVAATTGTRIATQNVTAIYNASGATLDKGDAVYIDGEDAGTGLPTVRLADNDTQTTHPVIGLVAADIANNTSGVVWSYGVFENWGDASSYSPKDPLFLADTPGELTSVRPWRVDQVVQPVGLVTRAANPGDIFVLSAAQVVLDSNEAALFTGVNEWQAGQPKHSGTLATWDAAWNIGNGLDQRVTASVATAIDLALPGDVRNATLTDQGAWTAQVYAQNDLVAHNSIYWAATAATTAGQEPGVDAVWVKELLPPDHAQEGTIVANFGTSSGAGFVANWKFIGSAPTYSTGLYYTYYRVDRPPSASPDYVIVAAVGPIA